MIKKLAPYYLFFSTMRYSVKRVAHLAVYALTFSGQGI